MIPYRFICVSRMLAASGFQVGALVQGLGLQVSGGLLSVRSESWFFGLFDLNNPGFVDGNLDEAEAQRGNLVVDQFQPADPVVA